MEYDTIVVPGCLTLRSTTLERLEQFKADGGNLIFLGDCPKYEDAKESDRPARLYGTSKKVSFTKADILNALEDKRFIDARIIRTMGGLAFHVPNGTRTFDILYQLRQDNDCKWLFITQGLDPSTPDVDPTRIVRITLNGTFALEEYDTMTGDIKPLKAKYENGKTVFERMWYMHDSLLLRLTDGKNEGELPIKYPKTRGRIITKKVDVKLDEPNALLLDMAEYKLEGDEEFCKKEEILRLDNILSAAFNLSRSSASSYIKQGSVYVDNKQILKSDFTVKEEDKVVLRGKGKSVLKQVKGETRKGRIHLVIKRYR
jgi:ribosomal 50S subunit-recycling heat shock protein